MKVVLKRWLNPNTLGLNIDTVIEDVFTEFGASKIGTITMMFDVYDEDGKKIDTSGYKWEYKRVGDIKE